MSYYENWLQAGGQPQPAVRSGNSVARDSVAPTAPKSKKGSGNQNPLTAWISELSSLGGAGAGAAIGTAILPGVGTLIGGGLGAGIAGFEGKLAENRIRDNQYDVGSAAREGGIDTLFGAGPLKLGKLGASAAKSAVTGRALPEALMAAQDTVAGKVGGQAAAQRSAQGFGVKVGGGTGQNVVTPDKADAVTQFIKTGAQKYGGIKPGAPINQARDAQAVHNKVISALDATLEDINRPLQSGGSITGKAKVISSANGNVHTVQYPDDTFKTFKSPNSALKAADTYNASSISKTAGGGEQDTIISAIRDKVAKSGAITGQPSTATKFETKISNAKDLKELEAIRREADDLAFTQSGAGKTSAAAQAHAVRDAIDEFITPLSKDYKAVKGDYGLSKQALEATSKAVNSAKGKSVQFAGTTIPTGSVVTNAENRVNGFLSAPAGGFTAKSAMARVGAGAAPVNSLSEALMGTQLKNSPTMPSTTDAMMMNNTTSNMPTSYNNDADMSSKLPQSPYSLEALNADVQRDPKNADKYFGLFQDYQKAYAPPKASTATGFTKPTAQQYSQAQTGLQSLNALAQVLQTDPSVVSKNASTPGQNLPLGIGSRISGAQGTTNYRAITGNILNSIARINTGANMPESERVFYENSYLPQPGDDAATTKTKIQTLYQFFAPLANYQDSSTGNNNDLVSALQQAGYGQ